MPRSHPRGFSKTEIRIVIILLGILLAVVIPQLTRAARMANDSTIKTTLQYLRGQVELFRAQHNGSPPQNGTMWALLQASSDTNETATTHPVGTHFGPYFHSSPLNALNNRTAASDLTMDTNSGWYYDANGSDYTLKIRNADGSIDTHY